MHAIWVHGNTAVPQFVGGANITSPGTSDHLTTQVNSQHWTDIVGLPQGPGKIFRGQAGTNFFHFCIPTPVILNDQRVRLDRVFVLFSSDDHVQVIRVFVFDGPKSIDVSAMSSGRSGRFDGTREFTDLIDGTTVHQVESRPEILFGIGISVEVRFSREGNITFTAAGADFS